MEGKLGITIAQTMSRLSGLNFSEEDIFFKEGERFDIHSRVERWKGKNLDFWGIRTQKKKRIQQEQSRRKKSHDQMRHSKGFTYKFWALNIS